MLSSWKGYWRPSPSNRAAYRHYQKNAVRNLGEQPVHPSCHPELWRRTTVTRPLLAAAHGAGHCSLFRQHYACELRHAHQRLRRDFSPRSRMICPANQHLRHAKESQAIEQLFTFVCANKNDTAIVKLLDRTYRAATSGAYFKISNYWAGLAAAVENNRAASGGKGLAR